MKSMTALCLPGPTQGIFSLSMSFLLETLSTAVYSRVAAAYRSVADDGREPLLTARDCFGKENGCRWCLKYVYFSTRASKRQPYPSSARTF
jgi:hypothetical protein